VVQDVANISRMSLTTGYRGALEYIFVVESEADPAAPVIRELIAVEAEKTAASERSKSGANLRLVVAGSSQTCSQKIFSMMAGIHTMAVGPLAFS